MAFKDSSILFNHKWSNLLRQCNNFEDFMNRIFLPAAVRNKFMN